MKKIITLVLILFSINILSQQTTSKKFQRKFNKLNTEKLDIFLVKNNFEKKPTASTKEIWDIKVDVSLYYNKEYNETFTLITCVDYKYSFIFVGTYLNDSLQGKNVQDIRSTFNYEYTYYKDEHGNCISFLTKDNE